MGLAQHVQPDSPVDRAGHIFQRANERAYNQVKRDLIPIQLVKVAITLRDWESGAQIDVVMENPELKDWPAPPGASR